MKTLASISVILIIIKGKYCMWFVIDVPDKVKINR